MDWFSPILCTMHTIAAPCGLYFGWKISSELSWSLWLFQSLLTFISLMFQHMELVALNTVNNKYKFGEVLFSKNSSNHSFIFLANFFEFWRLLIGWLAAEWTNQKSPLFKKVSQRGKNMIWRVFKNTSPLHT